jgi:hypothetical protein
MPIYTGIRFVIEILWPENQGNFIEYLRQQQHTAQNRFFRLDILGKLSL